MNPLIKSRFPHADLPMIIQVFSACAPIARLPHQQCALVLPSVHPVPRAAGWSPIAVQGVHGVQPLPATFSHKERHRKL